MKIKIEAILQVKASYEIDSVNVDYVEIEDILNARAKNKDYWIIRDGDGFKIPESVSAHIVDFRTSSHWENPGKPGPADAADADYDRKKDFDERLGTGAFEEMQAAFADAGTGVDDE